MQMLMYKLWEVALEGKSVYNLDDGLRKWKALFERKKNERERGLLPFPIMYLHKVWFYKHHFPLNFEKVWRPGFYDF